MFVQEKPSSTVDIVGVGLNATDTIIRLPHFPAFNSKVEFRVSEILPGGQVATAVTACALWGLKARYVGKIGDDSAGILQQNEMIRGRHRSALGRRSSMPEPVLIYSGGRRNR